MTLFQHSRCLRQSDSSAIVEDYEDTKCLDRRRYESKREVALAGPEQAALSS